jgi:Ca2+-binding RTX toxin-like protein
VSHRIPERLRVRALAVGSLVAAGLALAAVFARPGGAAPTELFFSEYVEGSGNNKALEVYNGTGAPVTLTGAYDVQVFANGSPTATATIPLTGTVPAGDAFVLVRSAADPALLALGDQTTTNFLFNGNDAVALRHAGAIVDVIGQIGVDPGLEWGTGDASTADNTLRRAPTVEAGDPNGGDAFDPSPAWLGFPLDTFDGLGQHTLSGGGGGGGGGGGSGAAPVARDDAASVGEDAGPLVLDVLANDTDADGDPLAVQSATDPAHGIATVAADGLSISYAPDVDFAGTDSFSYTAGDGTGGTDTATVTVTVTPANDDPDPEDDAATTAEDTPATIDVLANDLDVDGDTLVVSETGGAEHGTASLAPDGRSVVYAPAPNWNGVETLEVTVSDGHGGSDLSDLVVTVTAVDDPPVALGDVAAVAGNGSVVIDVAANDRPGPADESGQTLTVTSVGTPAHGTAELIASGADAGKVRYTPAQGFQGADSFTYVVSDGHGTATGNVDVSVAEPALTSLCALTPTIVGTAGDDVITGTPGDDVIRARRGDDVVDGNGGNDVICGGPGADRITTQGGTDALVGGTGRDTLTSGGGNDRVRGGFGADTIAAGEGSDRIAGGPGGDTIDAGNGDNRVAAGDGDDAITAGSGNDRIDGGAGTDTCDPGTGRNSVIRCE